MKRALYPKVASLKTAAAFRKHLLASGIPLDFDDRLQSPSPLADPIEGGGLKAGNRFCILPMEGWDGTRDGAPSDLTIRRWRNFGASGAKLIWGGEAVAVRRDGRANPNQLMLCGDTQGAIAALRTELLEAHRSRFGSNADGDLVVGLQLTHSGRFARPEEWNRPQPLAACHHPVLDRRFPSGVRVIEDDDLDRLTHDFVSAARLAFECGYQFIDLKQCHGYLGHELLGAKSRPGAYGGSAMNRMRFMTQVIAGIRQEVPDLAIVVRLSVFDVVPHKAGPDGVGAPESAPDPSNGFGLVREENLQEALEDARGVLRVLQELGIRWICTTAGSPYYNPHVQRPAYFPPLDGYQPPEDPLRGVARQIQATALLKKEFPDLIFVGSAYSYLQEWLPHIAQFNVRNGLTDLVGLGRMVLAYPELPADVLEGRAFQRDKICRTFSDCTTGPRLGLVSGCFPLDPFYANRQEAGQIRKIRVERTAERA